MNPCLCQLASPGRPKLTIAAHFSSQHLLRLLQRSIRLHRRSKPKRGSERAEALPSTSSRLSLHTGVVLNQLSWNWRECWQPAGSHASHWVAGVGQARSCEASAWMSRRPSSWSKLSTIVERLGQPVAASCAVATLASKARLRKEL